jgi:hypothetical protein
MTYLEARHQSKNSSPAVPRNKPTSLPAVLFSSTAPLVALDDDVGCPLMSHDAVQLLPLGAS